MTTSSGIHDFQMAADGFWQVHPGMPATLVETVAEPSEPKPGESVLDLYAGVGLFARFLADRVNPSGSVLAVEGDRTAAGHARHNLGGGAASLGGVWSRGAGAGRTARRPALRPGRLGPPREGARRLVVELIVARAPRAAAYVACDPAALARDVAVFAEHGFALTGLRAFDGFPMTHHVECVALLERDA